MFKKRYHLIVSISSSPRMEEQIEQNFVCVWKAWASYLRIARSSIDWERIALYHNDRLLLHIGL